jgi:hypothetical protein
MSKPKEIKVYQATVRVGDDEAAIYEEVMIISHSIQGALKLLVNNGYHVVQLMEFEPRVIHDLW